MSKLLQTQNNKLKTFFAVLFLGGLWGIIEATLGSILHLGDIAALGVFTSSTAVMVPIAYTLMGICYTRTNNFKSVIYMGIVAASIKIIACAILKMSFNPAMWIALESLAGAIAVVVIRPKKVLSFKAFESLAVASTTYLLVYASIKCGTNLTKWTDYAIKDCLAIGYGLVLGLVAKLISKTNLRNIQFKKILYSPTAASLCVMLAITLSVIVH